MVEVSVDKELQVIPQKDWDERIAKSKNKSKELINEIMGQGKPFTLGILSTNIVKSGDEVQLANVKLELDETLAGKLEMVEKANELVTAVYLNNGSYNKDLLDALVKIIKG